MTTTPFDTLANFGGSSTMGILEMDALVNEPQKVNFPHIFATIVLKSIPQILDHTREDGAIFEADSKKVRAPSLQAILPLAFCWAGLDPAKQFDRSPILHDRLNKLGTFLVHCHDDKGCLVTNGPLGSVLRIDQTDSYESTRIVRNPEQRLLYSWVEALNILRETGGDFDFDSWSDKIQRGCETIIKQHLEHLVGIRRFVGRYVATSSNHLSVYLTAVFRAGQVLGRNDFCELALPIARAFAEDIHPDGYWEEHGDLLRQGGPTPGYNYITHWGMALMYEWTKEPAFLEAIKKSTLFYTQFSYPDGTYLELIDERKRGDPKPRPWGLFGFSHTPEGRGLVREMIKTTLDQEGKGSLFHTENIARQCENFLFWHSGEIKDPPFSGLDHHAKLSLPAAIFRRKKWCIGLSAIYASQPEDPAYRDMSYALDRQKLFSVRHDDIGIIICGANAKNKIKNSTFYTTSLRGNLDYYPCGGTVGEEDGRLYSRAIYKSFYGSVEVTPINEKKLEILLSIDPVGARGPFDAGFNLVTLGHDHLELIDGTQIPLSPKEFIEKSSFGGQFQLGPVKIHGPSDMKITWPIFYQKNPNLAKENDYTLRVSVDLTFGSRKALFTLSIS